MGLIDRFTRDEASKYVWGALTLVAMGALVFAIVHAGNVLDDRRAAAQGRAVGYVEDVIDPLLDDTGLAAPTADQQDPLETAVVSILTDDRVSRVRLWSSTDGSLLFSSDRSDDEGSMAAFNDEVLQLAAREGTLTLSNLDETGSNDPGRSLLRTYVSLGEEFVVEIDQTDAGTMAGARAEWLRYELLAGVMVLALLVMTGLSLRDPIARINAGVPFAISSVPAGYSLIDNDRLHAVHEVYRLASERVGRLQQKLKESEAGRRRLEGEIQRTLSKAAATPTRTDASPPTSPPAAGEPSIVQVPESDVVEPKVRDARAVALAGPLARASRDQRPPPGSARKKERAKRAQKEPKDEPQRPAAAAQVEQIDRPAAPRPAALAPSTPAKEALAPADPVRESPTPVEAPVKAPAPSTAPTSERRVAANASTVDTAEPASTPVDQDAEDAKAHEAALKTFLRLTESDREHAGTGDVDQGAVRAALAKTAARKKRGGDRLQGQQGPSGDSAGGPASTRGA